MDPLHFMSEEELRQQLLYLVGAYPTLYVVERRERINRYLRQHAARREAIPHHKAKFTSAEFCQSFA